MNWNYISGFFDADGSITMSNTGRSKNKSVVLSFHNTEKIILEEIQKYIYLKLGHKGFISCKPAKKETHKDSYDLKYTHLIKCNAILLKMKLVHPKKIHRKKIALKLKTVTPRNGKYTAEILNQRIQLEQIFFNRDSDSLHLH